MMTATNNHHNTLAAALAYANLGLRVVPIAPGRKHPALPAWNNAATNNTDTIHSWFTDLYRGHGVGIALGPQPNGHNLFAVDIDGERGKNNFRQILANHDPLPTTWRSDTGGNGTHLIYNAPAHIDVRNQQAAGNRIAAGVDVRGNGGQIVVAPTHHATTHKPYAWTPGRSPHDIPVADAPDWLLELVAPPEPAPAPTPPRIDRPTPPAANTDDTPADHLRRHWNWPHELEHTGWTIAATKPNGDTWWTRPGKPTRDGHSAVLHGTDGPFVVFTTETPAALAELGTTTTDGSGRSYSPLEWYAAHNHHGNIADASRAIRNEMTAPHTPTRHTPAGIDPTTGEILATDEPHTDPLDGILIDWSTFWTADRDDADWLAEPIIAAKRGTALFAPGGTGKSLLALYIAAALATGRTLFGNPIEQPRRVLYLDYEMTDDDLAERLTSMDYGPDSDLTRLSYALLPSMPPLDTPEGGKAVLALAQRVDAELVVIDTLGRAVEGDENEADTIRNLYRHTGLHLKHDGRAFVRVDHAGKDLAKGQRGTSAKNDDVDVVWQMVRKDRGGYELTAKKRRMGWVPETVKLDLVEIGALRFELAEGTQYPAGTLAVVNELDDLGIDVNLSTRAAAQAFREAGGSARNDIFRAAVKYRKTRSETTLPTDHKTVDNPVDEHRGAPRGAPPEQHPGAHPDTQTPQKQQNTSSEGAPHKNGAHRGAVGAVPGAQCAPPKGAHAPVPTPDNSNDNPENTTTDDHGELF